MLELELVEPKAFSKEDIALLYDADVCGPVFNTIAPPDLVKEIWSEDLLLYRYPSGLLLLEVHQGGNGDKRLNIVRWAGKPMLSCKALAKDLQHIARELDCVAIETNVYSDGLAKALSRVGARKEAVVMVLELENGQ